VFLLLNVQEFILITAEGTLVFLPLAHVMERLIVHLVLVHGASIAFLSGDLRKDLLDELAIVKPTVLLAVPKVLQNIRQKIFDNFKLVEGCGKSMLESGLEAKRANFRDNKKITHWWYDTLVFSKVQKKFGGEVAVIISGSAPLPVELALDIKILLSCPIIEGYGMTETTGASFLTRCYDNESGHVGGPIPTVMVKLEGVKELNYTNQTEVDGKVMPCGEICIKGPSTFNGYFRDIENTEATIDKNGWVHTGDIGMILPEGKIKIVDRKKEMFKLSQGEYIAPTKLEGAYGMSKYVSLVCIYGDSEKSNIIAIIVPNRAEVKEFLLLKDEVKKDIKLSELDEYLDRSDVIKEIIQDFEKIHKEHKFNSLEKVHKVIISKEEFNHDKNKLLTPTQKMVRKSIKEYFKKEIDLAYKDKE